MDNLEFTENLFQEQSYPEYTEEDARLEGLMYLQCCGSCKNFKYYLGSGGFCMKKSKDTNNITLVDIMDNRCDMWEVSDEEKEFYEQNKQFL